MTNPQYYKNYNVTFVIFDKPKFIILSLAQNGTGLNKKGYHEKIYLNTTQEKITARRGSDQKYLAP